MRLLVAGISATMIIIMMEEEEEEEEASIVVGSVRGPRAFGMRFGEVVRDA